MTTWTQLRDDAFLQEQTRRSTSKGRLYVRRPDADSPKQCAPAFARCGFDFRHSVDWHFKPELPLERLSGKLGFPAEHATEKATPLVDKAWVFLALADYDGYGKPWTIRYTDAPIINT